MTNLVKDLKLLIYSYLSLEEILITFYNYPKLRNQIVSRGFYDVPYWNLILLRSDYLVAEYLLQNSDYPDNLTNTINNEDIKMLQLLHKYGFKFHQDDLDHVAYRGLDCIFFYFVSIGMEPTHGTLSFVYEGLGDFYSNLEGDEDSNRVDLYTIPYQKIISYIKGCL